MEFKICCTCKRELPKNEKYFFKRITTKEYHSFRSDCKECFYKKSEKRKKEKRFKELKCTNENYKEAWIENMSFNKTKHKELYGIKQSTKQHITKKIDNGYEFTTLDNYKEDVKENIRNSQIKHRKYNYSSDSLLSKKEINEAQMEAISKAIICNRFKIKANELPDELYENIKLTIKIKRELGLTHSTKKTINNK